LLNVFVRFQLCLHLHALCCQQRLQGQRNVPALSGIGVRSLSAAAILFSTPFFHSDLLFIVEIEENDPLAFGIRFPVTRDFSRALARRPRLIVFLRLNSSKVAIASGNLFSATSDLSDVIVGSKETIAFG
jgi:hypothetical protein